MDSFVGRAARRAIGIVRNWIKRLRSSRQAGLQPYKLVPEDFPVFPPPTPQYILRNRGKYNAVIRARKFRAPRGVFQDSSLYGLYQFYEYILLDDVIRYRNLIEWFWNQRNWAVRDIPDPQDADPVRYAFLACLPYLFVRAFNANIKIGLTRDAPAIMTMEQVREFQARPESEKTYETVPAWAENVPPLAETLSIPTHDGVVLNGGHDERADKDFLAKNIVIWTPHIFFT